MRLSKRTEQTARHARTSTHAGTRKHTQSRSCTRPSSALMHKEGHTHTSIHGLLVRTRPRTRSNCEAGMHARVHARGRRVVVLRVSGTRECARCDAGLPGPGAVVGQSRRRRGRVRTGRFARYTWNPGMHDVGSAKASMRRRVRRTASRGGVGRVARNDCHATRPCCNASRRNGLAFCHVPSQRRRRWGSWGLRKSPFSLPMLSLTLCSGVAAA